VGGNRELEQSQQLYDPLLKLNPDRNLGTFKGK
jgi:hypothetical protein